MTTIILWLWVCCAMACIANFLATLKDRSRAVRLLGGIIVGIIGPLVFPAFVFAHILKHMDSTK
jgi:lipopolysaccharide export LptBFGC system permease protein LptF